MLSGLGVLLNGFIANSIESFEFILGLSNGAFDLFVALCFRSSNYPRLIVNSMEPFELILGLFSGTFDLFLALCFKGFNYPRLIRSSIGTF